MNKINTLAAQAIAHAETLGWVPVDHVPEEWKCDEPVLGTGFNFGDREQHRHYVMAVWQGEWVNPEEGSEVWTFLTHIRPLPDPDQPDPTRALLLALADRVKVLEEALGDGLRAVEASYQQAIAEMHGHDYTATKRDKIVRAFRATARRALGADASQQGER